MTAFAAACRWYIRLAGHPYPNIWRLFLMLRTMVPSAILGGVLGAAWGDGWWPGFGVGVVIGGLLFVAWCVFVLLTVGVMRLRGVPLERFLADRR